MSICSLGGYNVALERSHMITVEAFRREHIDDAARIFAQSYKQHRKSLSLLPAAYERPEAITGLLEELAGAGPGVVAFSGGALAGYLAGFAGIPRFKGISAGVYVPEWGHAIAADLDPAAVFRSTYEALVPAWVEAGYFTQAITFFVPDNRLREWLYWNGFGLLVVDAMRSIEPEAGQAAFGKPAESLSATLRGLSYRSQSGVPGAGSAITIRSAAEEDLAELARLDEELRRYLLHGPTYLFKEPDEGGSLLGDDRISMVAEQDGRLVACIRGTLLKIDSCTVVQDEQVMGIDFAYAEPGVRGSGVGTRILHELLAWGQAQHKTACAVDFESANRLGTSFWLRHFQPVCYSAIRYVDPRTRETSG
jgi:GNAT superfamily N-acetyltransferase